MLLKNLSFKLKTAASIASAIYTTKSTNNLVSRTLCTSINVAKDADKMTKIKLLEMPSAVAKANASVGKNIL